MKLNKIFLLFIVLIVLVGCDKGEENLTDFVDEYPESDYEEDLTSDNEEYKELSVEENILGCSEFYNGRKVMCRTHYAVEHNDISLCEPLKVDTSKFSPGFVYDDLGSYYQYCRAAVSRNLSLCEEIQAAIEEDEISATACYVRLATDTGDNIFCDNLIFWEPNHKTEEEYKEMCYMQAKLRAKRSYKNFEENNWYQ